MSPCAVPPAAWRPRWPLFWMVPYVKLVLTALATAPGRLSRLAADDQKAAARQRRGAARAAMTPHAKFVTMWSSE